MCSCLKAGEDTRLQVTDIVWFDIQIGPEPIGRIEFGLFGKTVPKTVKNFVELSKKVTPGEGYRGSKFHRVVKGILVQGGDFTKGNGSGGRSIYGDKFKDENFYLRHYGAGWLSMANEGAYHTNSSQFFITLASLPVFDGFNVVFGKVLKGMGVVRRIEETEITEPYTPLLDVVVANCGLRLSKSFEPFSVEMNDADEERTDVDADSTQISKSK
jgi:peptidyl-prolyl cis-trans isomerase B (cyclophilin B)